MEKFQKFWLTDILVKDVRTQCGIDPDHDCRCHELELKVPVPVSDDYDPHDDIVSAALRLTDMVVESMVTKAVDLLISNAVPSCDMSVGGWVSNDPCLSVDHARAEIYDATGATPDTLVIPFRAYLALRNNRFIVERLRGELPSPELIAKILSVDRLAICDNPKFDGHAVLMHTGDESPVVVCKWTSSYNSKAVRGKMGELFETMGGSWVDMSGSFGAFLPIGQEIVDFLGFRHNEDVMRKVHHVLVLPRYDVVLASATSAYLLKNVYPKKEKVPSSGIE